MLLTAITFLSGLSVGLFLARVFPHRYSPPQVVAPTLSHVEWQQLERAWMECVIEPSDDAQPMHVWMDGGEGRC